MTEDHFPTDGNCMKHGLPVVNSTGKCEVCYAEQVMNRKSSPRECADFPLNIPFDNIVVILGKDDITMQFWNNDCLQCTQSVQALPNANENLAINIPGVKGTVQFQVRSE